jgi:hypothetical protein
MKKFFKIILGFFAGVALLISVVFFMTAGMPDVANDFFKSVKAKDNNRSQIHLHDFIKEDYLVIIKYLEDNGLNEVVNSSWNSRAFVNNNGNISGEVTTENNEKIKVRMTFIKQSGDWKIYSIQKQSNNEAGGAQIPSSTIQKTLVHEAMKTFMQSAKEKSMKRFHYYVSNLWRSQITVEKLDEIFGSIYQAKSDLSFLDNVTPEIENFSITDNEILVISGYFPTEYLSMYFTQKFIYEGTQWRLFGFEYNAKKPE